VPADHREDSTMTRSQENLIDPDFDDAQAAGGRV
jgi:hypothetical protein